MKHILTAIPALLGLLLFWTCYIHPSVGSGRESLGLMLILISMVVFFFERADPIQ